ncbi:hypothetical protein [Kitasatospora sp. NPDC005856]|uniref:hypothetical protein n=1 Tax=Kitasatospora sp. NPDC005856 TaxID=3154566 RepID=UPI0033D4C09F
MHYTGMAAVSVRLDDRLRADGLPASQFVVPLAVAIMAVIAIGGFVLTLSPQEPADTPAREPLRVKLFDRRT